MTRGIRKSRKVGVVRHVFDTLPPGFLRGKHPNCRCTLPASGPAPGILAEAAALIDGARAAAYGPVGENWGRTVAIFKAITGIDLTVQQGLVFMVAVKLAREYHLPKRDNIRDACGYLALYDRVAGGGEAPNHQDAKTGVGSRPGGGEGQT